MVSISAFLNNIKKLLRDNLWKASILSVIMLIYSTISEYLIENPINSSGIHSLFESLWWTMQTITTVGYGDVTIVGTYGKLNAMLVMVFGIGSFSFLLVSIAAEILDATILRRIGAKVTRMKDHVIVCNYGSNGKEILESILKEKESLVYLGGSKPPIDNDKLDFVNGSPLEDEDLKKAGIMSAKMVVIFPDERSTGKNPNATDAETILSAMNARRLNPDAFIIVELMNESNSSHARKGGIQEIIVRGKLSSYLIMKSIKEGNVGKFIQNILEPTGQVEISELTLNGKEKIYREIYESIEAENKRVIAVVGKQGIFPKPDEDSKYNGETLLILNFKSNQSVKA